MSYSLHQPFFDAKGRLFAVKVAPPTDMRNGKTLVESFQEALEQLRSKVKPPAVSAEKTSRSAWDFLSMSFGITHGNGSLVRAFIRRAFAMPVSLHVVQLQRPHK